MAPRLDIPAKVRGKKTSELKPMTVVVISMDDKVDSQHE